MGQRKKNKEEYLQSADEYIALLGRCRNDISSQSIRNMINELIASLQDFRIVQEEYDSGEDAVALLYDRYLPYLSDILQQYIRMESSGNYESLVKLRKRLSDTLGMMIKAVRRAASILPVDEMEDLNAEKDALEIKRRLDKMSGRK